MTAGVDRRRAGAGGAEILGQHDPVVDADLVIVDREGEAGDRIGGRAQAQIDRFLRLQVARAERARDRAVDRERADVDRQAVDEVGRGRR